MRKVIRQRLGSDPSCSDNTAPAPVFKASTTTNETGGSGCFHIGEVGSACLNVLKACSAMKRFQINL